MPVRPKRLCNRFGCKNLVDPGEHYCPDHIRVYDQQEKARHREYKQQRTDRKEQSFYSSPTWIKVRNLKLQMNPICEKCEQKKATMVDHIIPIKAGGAPYSLSNLQSMCWGCHNRKTAGETRSKA